MTQLTVPNPQDLQGQVLYDVSGREVGVIEGVYLDNATRAPEWAAVRMGPDALALVPLAEASTTRGGIAVDYDLDMVLDAPFHLTALDNEVTEDTEQLLSRYYEGGGGSSPSVVGAAPDVMDTAKAEAGVVAETARTEAADVAATARDEATQVAVTAKAKAGDVASTAKGEAVVVAEMARDETSDVAHVAVDEARDMLDTSRTELESQAEVQLGQFAESLHRFAGQALALARGNPEQAGQLGELVGQAGKELQSVAGGIEDRGAAGLLSDARRVVRQRPRAVIVGTAAAVVAGTRLMGTPAGGRLKQRLAPLKDQAIEAGKSVAEELKPIAQQRAEQVRAVATTAVDQVTQDAQDTVDDAKGTATRSAKTVKGTATRSAKTVKGTATRSAKTVKRTARAAAPVA